MRCPTLNELPPPPTGKTGWPWTEESPQLSEKMSDGSDWPRISIVTPNYNYGQFIEETIRSILLQGYPNLEYIVIDGNSTDASVDVIGKYQRWLTYWVSEKDNGQSSAINKGLSKCTGIIFNWINSDDQLTKGSLAIVSDLWEEKETDMIAGGGIAVEYVTREIQIELYPKHKIEVLDFCKTNSPILFCQPSTFLSLEKIRKNVFAREDLNFVMDWELYFRLFIEYRNDLRCLYSNKLLSVALVHSETKTNQNFSLFREEFRKIANEYYSKLNSDEKISLSKNLSNRDLQDNITLILNSQSQFTRLLMLFFRSPYVANSRMFWGAILRATRLKT